MDELRARAFLDLVLGKDSRPRAAGAAGTTGRDAAAGAGPGPDTGPAGGAAGGFAGRVTLTVPLGTAAGLADRPGELAGHGPVDPWLARDLAAAAARNPKTTWCVTVTDEHGHAVGHGCARSEPKSHRKRSGPGPPGGTGFYLHPGQPGRAARRVRHVAAARSGRRAGPDRRDRHPGHPRLPSTSTKPAATTPGSGSDTCRKSGTPPAPARCCRRPAPACDFEHNTPYEAGGRTCLCNGGPKCRHDHRLKQQPGWKVDQLPDGTFRWTTPAGRSYDTEPTRYPI